MKLVCGVALVASVADASFAAHRKSLTKIFPLKLFTRSETKTIEVESEREAIPERFGVYHGTCERPGGLAPERRKDWYYAVIKPILTEEQLAHKTGHVPTFGMDSLRTAFNELAHPGPLDEHGSSVEMMHDLDGTQNLTQAM